MYVAYTHPGHPGHTHVQPHTKTRQHTTHPHNLPTLGKSSRCTSSGSSMPFRVTMIWLGCSVTCSERISAATSSAVFHCGGGGIGGWMVHKVVSHDSCVVARPTHATTTTKTTNSTCLGELGEALLARPHGGVDDLEEELAGARVEDEDGAVDRLGRQVPWLVGGGWCEMIVSCQFQGQSTDDRWGAVLCLCGASKRASTHPRRSCGW